MRKKFFISLLVILELALFVLGGIWTADDKHRVLGIVLLVVGLVLLVFLVATYNKMIRSKNKVKEALALIDIQLKLRCDLIPNLVATVKGYAEHEERVFAQVTQVRTAIQESKTEEEKLEHNNEMVPLIRGVLAVSERYPQLKSDAVFMDLMEQLTEVEDRIVAARRIYDSNVNIYNTLIQVVPYNIMAYMYGFEAEKLFKIDTGTVSG